jgi:hypothetical protein
MGPGTEGCIDSKETCKKSKFIPGFPYFRTGGKSEAAEASPEICVDPLGPTFTTGGGIVDALGEASTGGTIVDFVFHRLTVAAAAPPNNAPAAKVAAWTRGEPGIFGVGASVRNFGHVQDSTQEIQSQVQLQCK